MYLQKKNKQLISLAFSPCPNDTFIFDAMVHHKIDTEGLEFDYFLADVENLNSQAMQKKFDLTKLSFFAYAFVWKDYQLLNAGSAFGNNCGPLLISNKKILLQDIASLSIAIPGKYTTANFLLSYTFPEIQNKKEIIFSEIENAIINGVVDAGVIIHESRFTYIQKELVKITDLGEYWEKQTGHPIPLGGIAIKRNFSEATKQMINRVMKRSVKFAFAHPQSSLDFVSANANNMDKKVMQKHINLYVNKYTCNLGKKEKDAIYFMYNSAFEKKLIPKNPKDIFCSLLHTLS